MPKTAAEIVALLGGTNAAARFFQVKPPSVSVWLRENTIHDDRLVSKAALLEQKTGGEFSRRKQWPDRYSEIWPELVAVEEDDEAKHVQSVDSIDAAFHHNDSGVLP